MQSLSFPTPRHQRPQKLESDPNFSNAGEGRVDRYRGVPPYPETRNYVEKVLDLYGLVTHRFESGLTEAAPWMAAIV